MNRNGIAAILVILLMAGCQVKNKNTNKSETMDKKEQVMNDNDHQAASGTLDSLLAIRRSEFVKSKPKAIADLYDEGITTVANSGILEKALNIGDKAPDFSLINQKGETLTLSDELKKGPVILTWYRGGWCPYCNINLHHLQERLPDFHKAGASLLALTPELPDKSLSTSEKHNLEFEVLSDVGNTVAKEYGVVFQLMKEVADVYQKGFDLHSYNGDESNELPLAATYVIDKNGIIQYAFLDADYRKRAEPDAIISALEKL